MAKGWTVRQVIARWHQLFSGTLLFQRYHRGNVFSQAEQRQLVKDIRL